MLARHRLRRICVQCLYQIYLVEKDADDVLELDWYHKEVESSDKVAIGSLVRGVLNEKDDISDTIKQFSKNWAPERIVLLARIVLEVSIFALKHPTPDAPSAVVIAEAIQLTEEFAGKEVVPLVNGILDSYRQSLQSSGS